MNKLTRAKRSLVLAGGTAAFALISASSLFGTTYPTTVFNVSSAVGFDGTNFNSLSLGLSGNAYALFPNSLVNLDPSLLVGTVTNSASSSGYTYSELYAVNIKNLSVSVIAFNDSNHAIVDENTGDVDSPSLTVVSPSGSIVGTQGTNAPDPYGEAVPTGTDVFTSNNGAAPAAIPLPTNVLEGNGAYSYTNTRTASPTPSYSLGASVGTINANGFSTNAVGPGGIVTGQITRYAGDSYSAAPSTMLGNDGYYYNPATGITTAIGLSGGQYDYNPSSVSDPTLMSHGTFVTGTAGTAATGFTYLNDPNGGRAGYDGWIYTPSAGTVQIGLVGGPYTYTTGGFRYEFTQIYRTNSQGQIAGRSSYVSAAGDPLFDPTVDAWLYTPSSTPGTASTFGTSSAGTYARLGLIASPSGSTLGYTNPVAGPQLPANERYTNIIFLENNGNAAGQSDRFDSSGNFQGQSAWYYNGTTNLDISPNLLIPGDTIHAAVAGGTFNSSNSVTAMNNTGMVAAYATRIAGTTSGSAALGQDAYIYDSNTGKEYFADPTDEASTTKYAFSYIGTLSDSGYALGFYNTYTGSTGSTQTTSTIFVWSELGKLQPLFSFANRGTTASAATLESYVQSFQFGSDGELYGPNTYLITPSTGTATSLVAFGLNVTWNNSLGTGDGQHWDTTSQNWTNGVIPLVYIDSALVTFNDANNGHYAVTINGVVSPNAVTFNNSAGNYTLSGSGGIAGGGGLTKLGSDSVTLSTINTYAGATEVDGGTLYLAAAGALPVGTNLNISLGAAVVASNLGTSIALTVNSLSDFGKLDLDNNGLIVHNGSIGTVTSLLQTGSNAGKWNGSIGITSTTAATNSSHLTALGAIINDTGANTGAGSGLPLYSTLDGSSTVDGDVIVKYGYYGDANLSGVVDGSDYSLIDNGYQQHLTGWYNGDFNYDGLVNGSDYTLIDNAYNTQGSQILEEIAPPTAQIFDSQSTSGVPEPAGLTLLGLGAAGLLGRHRRQESSRWEQSSRRKQASRWTTRFMLRSPFP